MKKFILIMLPLLALGANLSAGWSDAPRSTTTVAAVSVSGSTMALAARIDHWTMTQLFGTGKTFNTLTPTAKVNGMVNNTSAVTVLAYFQPNAPDSAPGMVCPAGQSSMFPRPMAIGSRLWLKNLTETASSPSIGVTLWAE